MTNEEKIQELLNEPCWDSKPYLIGMDKIGVEDVMERFADWKDEKHEQEKQQLIEKACEFWKHKFPYIDIDIIKEFVDTMKGE